MNWVVGTKVQDLGVKAVKEKMAVTAMKGYDDLVGLFTSPLQMDDHQQFSQ